MKLISFRAIFVTCCAYISSESTWRRVEKFMGKSHCKSPFSKSSWLSIPWL